MNTHRGRTNTQTKKQSYTHWLNSNDQYALFAVISINDSDSNTQDQSAKTPQQSKFARSLRLAQVQIGKHSLQCRM